MGSKPTTLQNVYRAAERRTLRERTQNKGAFAAAATENGKPPPPPVLTPSYGDEKENARHIPQIVRKGSSRRNLRATDPSSPINRPQKRFQCSICIMSPGGGNQLQIVEMPKRRATYGQLAVQAKCKNVVFAVTQSETGFQPVTILRQRTDDELLHDANPKLQHEARRNKNAVRPLYAAIIPKGNDAAKTIEPRMPTRRASRPETVRTPTGSAAAPASIVSAAMRKHRRSVPQRISVGDSQPPSLRLSLVSMLPKPRPERTASTVTSPRMATKQGGLKSAKSSGSLVGATTARDHKKTALGAQIVCGFPREREMRKTRRVRKRLEKMRDPEARSLAEKRRVWTGENGRFSKERLQDWYARINP